jgi:hypothetical protein
MTDHSEDENSTKQSESFNSAAFKPTACEFVAGQDLLCKVLAKVPGGYSVQIQLNDLPGFLSSSERITIGELILARYVGIQRNRHSLTWKRNFGRSFSQDANWTDLP